MDIPLVDLKAQYASIKPEIDKVIDNVLTNTSFILGPLVKDFENNLAKFCSCKHAIGTSSGTSALFLALKAYGVKEGDEVITAPNSFIATAEAIIHCGATPVFVDVDEETMLIDHTKIKEKITPKTKGIIPVHLYGQICEMEAIMKIAEEHKLFIIEDAAQAINAEYIWKKLPLSETAIFSFFPAKNLGAYGDAGAVITNNEDVAKKVLKLRDHGRTSKYESDIIGYGARLDALQAAVLNAKLQYLSSWTTMRRYNSHLYNQLLADQPGLIIPCEAEHRKNVYYMYVIRTKHRDVLMDKLKMKGVSCGIHYPVPLHLQPALAFLGYKEGDFPIAEKAAKEILSLPMYPELTPEQIKYVVASIKEVMKDV